MTLDEATKDCESRFKRIVTCEPCAYVSVSEMKEHHTAYETVANTVKIPFVVVSSGNDAAGNYKMFPTEAGAIAAWKHNMDAYLAANADAETFFWRVKPESAQNTDFEKNESGWAVYSRLAVR